MTNNSKSSLAGIEYIGIPGVSAECQESIMRLLQYHDEISLAKILSYKNQHAFLLTVNGDFVAVKSGFTSGYFGEGPHAFSYIIQLFNAYKIKMEEHKVNFYFFRRLEMSSLTVNDIEKLNNSRPVRPSRLYDYVLENHYGKQNEEKLWQEFRPVIPLAIIDTRIIDLAIKFWENPDDNMLTGYRRLEDIFRKRTGIKEHGQKLFSQAFSDKNGKLSWKNIDGGEHAGRVNLFTGIYMAYRNPRAHRELSLNEDLAEFLLLNHLYILEKEAYELQEEQTIDEETSPAP